jgi:hypothetical protein
LLGYAARVMAGLKKPSPLEFNCTHYMIYRESLDMKELFPELSEVMDRVDRSVRYTKAPLR